MKKRRLGNSDLMVSEICMGCMGFGDPTRGQHTWTLDEKSSREIIIQGLEAGINFFNTAIAYQSGTSEKYLGKAIREVSNRDDVIIATKFLPKNDEEIEKGINGIQHVENMLNKSLENLGMDHVDLYIYHMWDHRTPLIEILEGLNKLVKQGKTRYIGISNCFAWQLAQANDLARERNLTPFVSVQNHYNLIFREEEREMKAFCEQENIAMTPYSSLAGGRLSKHLNETSKRLKEDGYARLKYDSTKEVDQKIIERVEELASAHHTSMSAISLAWLLTKTTSPIVGMTKPSHVKGAVDASNLVLNKDEIHYLEELYVPHKLVGVMAQNTKESSNEAHVWSVQEKQ